MKYSATRIKLLACLTVLLAGLAGWILNRMPAVTATTTLAPSTRGKQAGTVDGASSKQALDNARAALEAAMAKERANPTKESALAVDAAFAEYNLAVASRVAQIQSRMVELAAIITGGKSTATAVPRGAKPSAELAEHNSLSEELRQINPGADAPTPVVTPEAEPNNTCPTANVIPVNQNCGIISGSISPANDVDFFAFTASAGARVWIYVDTGGTLGPGANSTDSFVTLFDPSCTAIIEEDDDDGTGNGCDTTTETTLASVIAGRTLAVTGTYFIRVRAFDPPNQIINPYKLFVVVTNTAPIPEFELNDDNTAANPLVTASQRIGLRSGTISGPADQDYYSVVATTGEVLFISADGDPERDGVSTDMVVELRSPIDAPIFLANSGQGGTFSNPEGEGFCFTITTPGTYFVRVNGFGGDTGSYALMVAACNSDPPGGCGPALIINGASTTSETDTTAEATSALSAILTAQGTAVTVADTPPQSLAGFSCVYDIRFATSSPITAAQSATYLSYLQSGGRLYITGEHGGFTTRNDSVIAFVATAGGGALTFCELPPPYTCDDATICSSPNPVTTLSPAAPGGTSPAPTGTSLITSGGGACRVSSVWRPGQLTNAPNGALITMFDVNILQPSFGGGSSNQNLIRNIAKFLCCRGCGPSLIINGASTSSEPGTTAEATVGLSDILTAQGSTVIVADVPPPSLAGFGCVYDIRFSDSSPVTAAQSATFLTYLQSGGKLYLTGENFLFPIRNNSVFAFVAAAGGSLGPLTFCSPSPPDICSDATICSTPNPVAVVQLPAPGGTTGSGNGGALLTSSGGTCRGASIWRPGQLTNAPTGSLIMMLDINVLQPAFGFGNSNQNLIRNIANFLCCASGNPCASDVQPPVITCPANIISVTPAVSDPCAVVNFEATASDNCSGATVICNPPSGSCFPVGVTTVTCTATDSSGNTATCTFTVTMFSARLQDDSEGCNNMVLFNTITGDYRWCCRGTIFTGRGKVTRSGNNYTIDHNPPDRRVLIRFTGSVSPPSGTASLQSPPGTIRCVITDRDTRNDLCLCGTP